MQDKTPKIQKNLNDFGVFKQTKQEDIKTNIFLNKKQKNTQKKWDI